MILSIIARAAIFISMLLMSILVGKWADERKAEREKAKQ